MALSIGNSILCVLLVARFSPFAHAQSFDPPSAQPARLLAPGQLDDLVAPIAFYPDPLLSQVLAASTYPLEIVDSQQWLQENRNLQGQRLIAAVKQQNWDPSVQLLVAFPDTLALLSRNIRWTTSLGNAFLGQRADVMDVIQRLRASASNNGRLATSPEQTVTTETREDRSAIRIQPADPQMIYTPVYNSSYVGGDSPGSSSEGEYESQSGSAPGFGPGANLGGLGLLGSGILGGGWGWILNWFTHTLSLNNLFLNTLGFNGFGGGGPAVWAHNPVHRHNVPYSNGFEPAHYRGADFNRGSGWPSDRSGPDGWHRFGMAGSYDPGGVSDRGQEDYRRSGAMPRTESNLRGAERQMRFDDRRMPSQHSSFRNERPPEHFSRSRVSSSHFSPSHSSGPRGPSHFSAPHRSGGGHSSKRGHKH